MISVAAAALRTGLGRLAPHTVRLHHDERGSRMASADVRTHLSAKLGTPVDVALYIGPPRAVRKPLLQVLNDRGHTVAFAKLGVDDFTRALVRHEAAALEEVHERAPRWVVPPPVLHHGSWQGHQLLVLGALRRGGAVPADNPVLTRAADEIARLGPVHDGPLSWSGYWTRPAARQDRLPPTKLAQTLLAGTARLANGYP